MSKRKYPRKDYLRGIIEYRGRAYQLYGTHKTKRAAVAQAKRLKKRKEFKRAVVKSGKWMYGVYVK